MALGKISRRWRICLVGLVVLVASAGTVAGIRASGTGPAATAVLGEGVFDTNYFSYASSIANPAQITIDAAGHLYVADLADNRVLGWHSASSFANNDPADLVIGQLDFLHTYANQGGGVATLTSLNSPQGVATDSDGNLYVADLLNSRVTEYTSPFSGFTGTPLAGQSANLTIAASNLGLGESLGLTQPAAVAVDGNNNLFVSELGNNSRVLEFLDPLATGVSCTPNADGSGCAGDIVADFVLGQSNLTNIGCAKVGIKASTLCFPYGLAVDPGTNNLYVADRSNNRVLVFPAPISTGESAAQVWGQPNFLSSSFGTGPDLFNAPSGVALDSAHNLYVSDTNNNRALGYAAGTPYPSTSPSLSWGRADPTNFTDAGPPPGEAGFLGSTVSGNEFQGGTGIALDGKGGLYIADAINNRVLVFDNALAPTESGTRVLGQADLVHGMGGDEIFDASMLSSLRGR
jgi:DNA-binding beta-propeller fold protein YncE